MWDLVGNPEDRFSHNEAHDEIGPALKRYTCIAEYAGDNGNVRGSSHLIFMKEPSLTRHDGDSTL